MVGSKCRDFKNREVSNVNAPTLFSFTPLSSLIFVFSYSITAQSWVPFEREKNSLRFVLGDSSVCFCFRPISCKVTVFPPISILFPTNPCRLISGTPYQGLYLPADANPACGLTGEIFFAFFFSFLRRIGYLEWQTYKFPL